MVQKSPQFATSQCENLRNVLPLRFYVKLLTLIIFKNYQFVHFMHIQGALRKTFSSSLKFLATHPVVPLNIDFWAYLPFSNCKNLQNSKLASSKIVKIAFLDTHVISRKI